MAIYPVDSPGGFQMLGRTIPYFDLSGCKKGFTPDRPWLYQNFDIITFQKVSKLEMGRLIALYKCGRYEFKWKNIEFDMAAHNEMLLETAQEVQELKRIRGQAQSMMIQAEKESFARWKGSKDNQIVERGIREALLIGMDAIFLERE